MTPTALQDRVWFGDKIGFGFADTHRRKTTKSSLY